MMLFHFLLYKMQILDPLTLLYFVLYSISTQQKMKLLFIFVYYLKIDKMQYLINIFDFLQIIGLQFIIQPIENLVDQLPTYQYLI